jgi:hypothetical protein
VTLTLDPRSAGGQQQGVLLVGGGVVGVGDDLAVVVDRGRAG